MLVLFLVLLLLAHFSLDDGRFIGRQELNSKKLESGAVSIIKFLVEGQTKFVSNLFPSGPIVSHIILCRLLLDHTFNLCEKVLFIVDVINLIHLWESVPDQLILERERHGDGHTRANSDWFLLTARQIGEVHVHLGARELNEFVERANDVPAPFVDLSSINVFGECVILKTILNWLDSSRTEGQSNDAEHNHCDRANATAGSLVIHLDFLYIFLNYSFNETI